MQDQPDSSLQIIRELMEERDMFMPIVLILSEANKFMWSTYNQQHTVLNTTLTAQRAHNTHRFWLDKLDSSPANSWIAGLARKKLLESDDLLVEVASTEDVRATHQLSDLSFSLRMSNYRRIV